MTDFDIAVYSVVKTIPCGKVATYGWVAEKIGRPKACRAVGSSLRKNQYLPGIVSDEMVVPCHRVVGSTGKLCGYSGSSDCSRKIELLNSEGVVLNSRGCVPKEYFVE